MDIHPIIFGAKVIGRADSRTALPLSTPLGSDLLCVRHYWSQLSGAAWDVLWEPFTPRCRRSTRDRIRLPGQVPFSVAKARARGNDRSSLPRASVVQIKADGSSSMGKRKGGGMLPSMPDHFAIQAYFWHEFKNSPFVHSSGHFASQPPWCQEVSSEGPRELGSTGMCIIF